jgi:hypothetical protein
MAFPTTQDGGRARGCHDRHVKGGRREVMKVIEKSPILIALKNGRRSNLCRLPGAPGKYVARGLRNCGAVGVVVADL